MPGAADSYDGRGLWSIYTAPLPFGDGYRWPASKTAWNSWQLEAGPDGIYVTCGYGKKLEGPYSRMETIRLPNTVQSCRADFKTGPKQGNLTLVRFSCQ